MDVVSYGEKMRCTLLVFTMFFASLHKLSNGKIIQGELVTAEKWHFLTRFCFLSVSGKIDFEFEYPVDYAPQNVLLYYDDADQWPAVYKTKKTCWQKEAVLIPENNQKIVLTDKVSFWHSGCNRYNISDVESFRCKAGRSFRSSRERWWFIAISNCASTKNCHQKEAVLRPENNQIVSLTLRYTYSGCSAVNDSTTGYVASYRCSGGRQFRSYRERWWFITVSNCESTKGLKIKYKLWLTNGDNVFFKHFSADEFYILQTDIFFLVAHFVVLLMTGVIANILQVDIGFLVAYSILLVLSILVAIILKSRQLFHTTYKLYMVSLGLQVIYLLLMCIVLGKYANDGFENRGLINFARIFETVSILIFILMLILMGKGYTITRGRLSQSGSIKIAVFMTLYTITYAVLFIYEAVFFDPGEVLYLYESPPGYGLIALRLIAWVWFCYAIFFTLKHYPEKSLFYYPFFILYTLWYWAGPIIILLSMFVMGEWVREKTVNGVLLTANYVAYLIFLILTRPGAANKNFPYHVRTSQIGIMTNSELPQSGTPMTASKQSDSFASRPYAPSVPPTDFLTGGNTPDFNDLFCVQKEKSPPNTQQNGKAVSIDSYPHQYPNGTNPFIVTQTR